MAGAIGTINWWGFSPTINLLDFVNHEKNKDESNNAAELCVDDTTGAQLVAVPKDSSEKICDNPGAPVNILLVGASDCRHILKIMAEIAAGYFNHLLFCFLYKKLHTKTSTQMHSLTMHENIVIRK